MYVYETYLASKVVQINKGTNELTNEGKYSIIIIIIIIIIIN